jgi:hypothetical protein
MMLNRMRYLILALPLLATATLAQNALPLGAGVPLPDRVMQNASGQATSFNQQMGPRGLAVVFWSSACPWVTRNEARLIAMAREYMPAGIGFVAINSNDPASMADENLAAMRTHASREAYGFAYVLDEGSAAARAFGATRTPQIFLFDGGGRLVYEGAIDDSPADARRVESAYFRDGLAAVVAGEPVLVERTRPFGCTIKLVD